VKSGRAVALYLKNNTTSYGELKMVKQINLKYGMIFGFVGLIITLVVICLTTGMLDLRFAAVVVAGFFWWRISWLSDEKVV